jgi:hypothetical protein
MRPAVGASRSIDVAHGTILPPVPKFVNFKIKLGHCKNQIRPQGVKTGQHQQHGTDQIRPFSKAQENDEYTDDVSHHQD